MKLPKILIVLAAVMIIYIQLASSGNVQEIVVEETELVKLELDVVDEDGDPLTYTFDKPLNEKGEWQTDYGDAGEYSVTITVSDGIATITQDIMIIVEAKNREPVISGVQDIVVPEGETVYIEPDVADYEDDPLTITISEPVGDDGVWETGYDDEGIYIVTITASDEENTVTKDIEVVVEDFDRKPFFDNFYPEDDEVTIDEGEEILFSVWASDLDEDVLLYEWRFDGKRVVNKEKEYKYISDFDDSGKHNVEVIVSDGEKHIAKTWEINVKNVNRVPVIKEAPEDILAKEGDFVKIEFAAYDPDGDDLKYKVSEPIGNDMEWQIGFDDAGEYEIDVKITDGKLETSESFVLTVENVNRAPVFEEIENVYVLEGGEIEFDVVAYDPDGDEVTVTAEGLPIGAEFDGEAFSYAPPYYTVNHPKNFLQTLFHGSKTGTGHVSFTATDGDLSSRERVVITVEDVNLAPVLQPFDNIIVNEGEKVVISPEAADPDGDDIIYTFAWPIGVDGEWQTDFDDCDIYVVTVNASDGSLQDSKDVTITVENTNRAPTLDLIENVEVKEKDEVEIVLSGSDIDGDEIIFYAENLPEGALFNEGVFSWTPDYDATKDKDEFVVTFSVTDGIESIKQDVTIGVVNKNRAPVITGRSDATVKVKVGESAIFSVEAEDPDGDKLGYYWKFGLLDGVEGPAKMKRTFNTPGKKVIEVIVSDGEDRISAKYGVLVYDIIKKEEPAQKVQEPVEIVSEPAVKPSPQEPVVYIVEG